MTDYKSEFMKEAIRLSVENVKSGGGPFGAVVVKNNEIIASGFNMVTQQFDPSAHAEIVAIRNACNNLNSFQLTDCDIYTSCEPCPMCLGAIFWARPRKVYFANSKTDAANHGFDDQFIYDQIELPAEGRKIPMIAVKETDAISAFKNWSALDDKVEY